MSTAVMMSSLPSVNETPKRTINNNRIIDGDGGSRLERKTSFREPPVVEEHSPARIPRTGSVASSMSQQPPAPPDGGWGWLIVFAAFVSCAGVVGLTRAFGIIYVEILHAFPESTALEASWIPGLYNTLSTGLAPVAGALSNRFSPKVVVFTGGLLMSTGLILNYFANSILYLCISFGVVTGVGAGLCTTPGIIMVARYFRKRRALANGLCLAGTSSGAFIQPLLVEYLTNRFGFRGAMLIMGGLMLHISAFALVYRPLEHPSRPLPSYPIPVVNRNRASCAKRYFWFLTCLVDRCFRREKTQTMDVVVVTKNDEAKCMLNKVPPASVVPMTPVRRVTREEEALDDLELGGESRLLAIRNQCLDHSINDLHTATAAQMKESLRRRKSLSPSVDRQRPNRRTELRGLRRYLDFTLFRNRAFVLFVASSACTSVGYPHASVFMPAYATSMGIAKSDAGLLLSIMAGADLLGRIGFGWLSDQNLFQRIHGYMFNVALAALATLILPIATNYAALIAHSVFYGLGVGSFFMLTPVILTDHHGAEKVASSYGLLRMFHGIMSIATPPVAGILRDVTGEYSAGFYLMGSFMLIGSVIIVLLPSALRHEEKKAQASKMQSVASVDASLTSLTDRRYSTDPRGSDNRF